MTEVDGDPAAPAAGRPRSRLRTGLLIAAAAILLGYASNAVSRPVIINRMGVNYMGGAMGRNPTLTRQFTDSAISTLYIPYYVRVSVLLSLGGGKFSEVQSGIHLFGLPIVRFASDRSIR